MAMLISLVNNYAPDTAMNIDIHFPVNLCRSVIEMWLESRITSTTEMNFCFLRAKKTEGLQTGVAVKPNIRN